MPVRLLISLFALFVLVCLNGCPAVYVAKDERTISAQYSDAQIEATIKGNLVQQDASQATKVNVYSFRGHVFLVGEVDKAYRAFAQKNAAATPGVHHVTTHWFAPGASHLGDDTQIEAAIDSNLLFADKVGSTRVNVDVWGGHVVLLGILSSQDEIKRAVQEARKVKGVKSVTSYLMTNKQSLDELNTPPTPPVTKL